MKELIVMLMALLTGGVGPSGGEVGVWPDGTLMDAWFRQAGKVDVDTLGRQYVLTDYGVASDSTCIQTARIQAVIDRCAREGGGVVVVPEGTFLTGALFFRQGTHLHLREGATLKGSERIADYPVLTTRIEGETCPYFAALVNADGVDGFSISGTGTIDGNGHHYWREFWIRRRWNPQCTNKDAQRPRLTYISHSSNVTIQDVHLVNSAFWTNHVYKSHHVRYIGCHISAPLRNVWDEEPQRGAPSSDAIDIDACSDILVRGCYMSVNDDAVALKGGKGTWADRDSTNGPNERILIEDCSYGEVHSCLTLGSESVYDCNVVLRRCHTAAADRVLWLKMRPDTPQHYEHVLVEDITGHSKCFLFIHPWTQFFQPGDRPDRPRSRCNDIVMRRITVATPTMFDVQRSDAYQLDGFRFDDRPLSF